MDAEIIAVGSELLTPERLDTNSLFLTEQLNSLGVEVVAKMVIGDDVARLADAVRLTVSRSGITVLSGGLGPTEDDVTREAVARALGRRLVYHPGIAESIEKRFRRMNRQMAEINRRQAYVIEGAEVLANGNGTAPGQWVEDSGRVVALLPGPPSELKPMFLGQCMPRLERVVPRQAIRTRFYRVTGVPESDLDQLIAPVYKQYSNPVTTILAAPGDIQIHLRARCVEESEAEALLAEIGPRIEALLGDRIYSSNGDPLEAVIGERLRARGATLSVAESCTGGLLAERITSIPGSSDYFVGGFLVYANRLKTELLGVDAALLAAHGAVSEPVAEAMALGARSRTDSTFGLSITGIAGPAGGTEEKPVGTVVVGLAGPDGCRTHRFRFLGDRARVRSLSAQSALDLLRKELGGTP
ncbi:MAG: competence/damage-inducible protein A [Acidobacteria bacterium]|nr:competence/damage-inducible protein A [Acidobacteriota bacterium]